MTNFNELNQTNNLSSTSTGPVNAQPTPTSAPAVENPTAAGDLQVTGNYAPKDISTTQSSISGNFDTQTRAGDVK